MTRARPRASVDDPRWYKDAIIYEVRTRSFFDSNGDGVGDIKGLTSKLDYLADLGITAVWLLPQYPSPLRDDGYDIADYTAIHPDVGTLEDFDELVIEAHRRKIRVITELVLNHTSDQHTWFQRARRAPPGSPERDFYVWSDTTDRYREARIIFRDFEPSNWTWDPIAKAYYWHRFFSHQPDLNFDSPAVHDAVLDVVDFWFARGVDGLRLDAVPYLYEAEGTSCENLPATHAFLKKLRRHVDERFPNRMLLAEANQWPEDAAAYFGDGDECHMNFHFPIMPRLFMAIHMEDRFPIIDILRQTPELHPSCQWAMFLRNHDELTLEMVTDEERDYMYRAYAHDAQMRINLGIRRRLAPLVGNDRRKMELLNGLLLSMPGTPVLYYGDEIGMGDNVWLGDRNGVRTPMQWSADRNAGFSRANPHRLILPINVDPEYHYEAINVEAQQSNPSSLLWWTKRLVALRKRHRAFGRGSMELLHPSNPRVLAFVRRFEEETILVVANLSRHTQYVELDLADLHGMIPVEAVGRTPFPPIGGQLYLLTLGGHDFYWLSVEPPRQPSVEERMSLHAPPSLACASADALLFGEDRRLLEEALPSFLEARASLAGAAASLRVVEATRVGRLVQLFARVEYDEGEPESFCLYVEVAERGSPATTIAHLHMPDGATLALVEATPAVAGRALLDAIARGENLRGASGAVACALLEGAAAAGAEQDARVLGADRFGTTLAFGERLVLKMLHLMEEGTSPELEVGRVLQARGATIAPAVLGYVEYRVPRGEPLTLALLEEHVVNEGTAWQHAKGELGRVYERALTRPPGDSQAEFAQRSLVELAQRPIVELAQLEPPEEHALVIGGYLDSAALLGERVADLHLALASSTDPSFEPHAYTPLDQRSKYQTARNRVGRVLAQLRRSLRDLPAAIRPEAELVIARENDVLACFEPILGERIRAKQIRCHGDLDLKRVLFTGKDFVIVGVGASRDRRIEERRRKMGAFRDVAGILRSFHYAAATTLAGLRPEDQARAEPWSSIWLAWTSAAFLRGYLDAASGAPFVPESPSMRRVLVETALLERAFGELRAELRHRPEMAAIPLRGILRMLGPRPE